jgi:hypothetical protein
MTENTRPGAIEGLLSDTEISPASSAPDESSIQEEVPEGSIKELLSEASLPSSDVLAPPQPPRKKRSLGIG